MIVRLDKFDVFVVEVIFLLVMFQKFLHIHSFPIRRIFAEVQDLICIAYITT